MENDFFLSINGKLLTYKTILNQFDNLISESNSDWENELFCFIKDWNSPEDYINIKTSGSTGLTKNINLPKNIMRQSAIRTINYFGLNNSDNILLNLSCGFIAGKMMIVRAIVAQMNIKVVDPKCDFSFLEEETFSFGAMVPNQLQKILDKKNGNKLVQNIKNLIIGGAAVQNSLCKQISNFNNRIVSTYGMTESASHIAFRELTGESKPEYYTCLNGIKVDVNEKSCLLISIPEFSEIIETNDIAVLSSPFSFKILGRADNVINSGGIKYLPENIESKLVDLIKGRFVISSLPDDKLGERIVLVFEGIQSGNIIDEIRKSNLLDTYEIPKEIFSLKNFPETINSKIKREEIKQLITHIR